MIDTGFIFPGWPAPANIRAAVTSRAGGSSLKPYDGFNLATHVGDTPSAVAANRAQLREALNLPTEPSWLRQVHGVKVVDAARGTGEPEADGAFSSQPGVVCAVLTADCLPLLLCDRAGTRVAALHAGWRGLVNGIIEAGVRALEIPASELLVWLGPAIGPDAFEVGAEVREQFMQHDPAAAAAFRATGSEKYFANIYQLARQRLTALGVQAVYGGDFCTVRDAERFYSYRREGVTGRMVSLIWLSPA